MISSLIIYNALLFLCVLSAYLTKISTNSSKKILNVFTFLLLFGIAALRSGVGSDFEDYVRIFENIDRFKFNQIEPIYFGFNKLLNILGFQAQSIFVVMGAIAAFFAVKASQKTKYPELFIFSYVTLIYLNSLNAMRQEIATTILLYALLLLIEGKTKTYILLVLFATGFHYVSILLLPFVFINKIKYDKKTVFLTALLAFLFIRVGVIEILASSGILSGTKYVFYLNSELYNQSTETGLGNIIILVAKHFSLLIPFFIPKSRYPEQLIKFRNATLILNSCLLLVLIASLDFYILHRLVSLFTIANIFSLLLMVEAKIRSRQIWVFVTILLMLFYFENDIHISRKNVPGKGITPYVTIFERN